MELTVDCERCGLYKTCLHPRIGPEGPLEAEVLFVGEAPGEVEDLNGRPFCGESGQILRQALAQAGLERPYTLIPSTAYRQTPRLERVCFTNIVLCRPPENATPTGLQAKCCFGNTLNLIKQMPNLKLIVPVGNVALRAFTGKQGITSVSGTESQWEQYKLMPLVHPATIIYAKNRGKLEEFNTHVCRIPSILEGKLVQQSAVSWHQLASLSEWKEYLQRIYAANCFAYDLETTGLNPFRENQYIKMVSFAINEHESVALVFDSWVLEHLQEVLDDLKILFEDPKIQKIGANEKFDRLWLRAILGIQVQGISDDVQLSQYALHSNRANDLKSMAWDVGLGGYEKELRDEIAIQDAICDEKLIKYGCYDSLSTYRIFKIHQNEFKDNIQLYQAYRNILLPASAVLGQMEYNGIRIDPPRLHISTTKTNNIISKLVEELKEYSSIKKFEKDNKVEFNPNSHVQLRSLLFDKRYENLEPFKKTKKKKAPSTDKEVLDHYKDTNALASLLYVYSQYTAMQKFCKAILKNLTPDNRLHTTYYLSSTASGRSSSSDPNLQNLAKGQKDLISLRRIFVADPGYVLIEADYAGMELRCMAEEAQDDVLKQAILTGDVHRQTAAIALKKPPELVTEDERRMVGKSLNFGIIYGSTEHGVARTMKCDLATARRYIDNFFSTYKKTKEWMDRTMEFVREHRYVQLRSGFRRYFPGSLELTDHELRSAVNTPIQGLAGNILFMALIGLQDFLDKHKLRSFLTLEIHDSVVCNIHESEISILPELKHIMETYFLNFIDFSIPIQADIKIGPNLGEMEEWK
jgi:DNA polymerase-1